MKHIISFIPNLELISSYHQILYQYLLQFFYNNLTTCHKELQVFLELIGNHCVMHVIHQDILDQLGEYILENFFN